jgi:AcrR family transcriptional regulator
MAATVSKVRSNESLRNAILSAAGELFSSEGYERTSMRKIAQRIDYSPTAIYLHFRDKEDLLRCLCEETFERLAERFEQIADPAADPVSRLKGTCRAYVEFGVAHPNHYRATFTPPAGVKEKPGAAESINAAGMKAFEHMRRSVQACIDAGQLTRYNADIASQALWCGMHGVTSLLIAKCSDKLAPRELLVTALVDSLVDGMTVAARSA